MSHVANNAVERCYLLELPVELRIQIYEYLLSPSYVELASADKPTILGRPYELVAKTRFVCVNREACFINILQTCYQIYEEAEPILYSPEELVLRPSGIGGRMEDKAKLNGFLNISKLHVMRALTRLHVDIICSLESIDEDVAHSEALLRAWSPRC